MELAAIEQARTVRGADLRSMDLDGVDLDGRVPEDVPTSAIQPSNRPRSSSQQTASPTPRGNVADGGGESEGVCLSPVDGGHAAYGESLADGT